MKQLDRYDIYDAIIGTKDELRTIASVWDFGKMELRDIDEWIENNCNLVSCNNCGYWVDEETVNIDHECEDCQ